MKYLRPRTVQQASAALAEWGEKGRILAGGTDLLIGMRRGFIHPDAIIDVTCLEELRGIRREGAFILIGALTTHSQVRHSPELAAAAPLLVRACREVGSVQIRNLATIGGNLANASPAGDSIPPLRVLEAEIQLVGQNGSRWVEIEDFFIGPGKTARQPDELIAAVRFLPLTGAWKTFFAKLGQRNAVRVAKVSVAGAVAFDGDRVTECRLALGAVAPTVIRVQPAEELLANAPLDSDRIREAARLAAEACAPITDIRSTVDYRRAMVSVLVRRELEKISNEVKR